MRRRQLKTHNKQQGSILIELVLVVSIMSIIAAFTIKANIAKNVIEKINSDANLAKNEVEQVFEAASGYLVDQDEWPDFSNSCSGAFNTLATTTPTAYLRNISNLNLSPYITTYQASCNTNTFTVSIDTLDADQALVLSNKIANASVVGTVVTASIPRPEEQPTLTQFLMLDGSRTMTGDLDMGGNGISNVGDVAAADGRSLVNIETIAPLPTASVNKPTCPIGKSPSLNLAISGIVLANSKMPFSNPPFIESQTATQWIVRLDVFDEDGVATAKIGTFIQATTMCK